MGHLAHLNVIGCVETTQWVVLAKQGGMPVGGNKVKRV